MLQHLNVFLVVRDPKLNTVLKMQNAFFEKIRVVFKKTQTTGKSLLLDGFVCLFVFVISRVTKMLFPTHTPTTNTLSPKATILKKNQEPSSFQKNKLKNPHHLLHSAMKMFLVVKSLYFIVHITFQ